MNAGAFREPRPAICPNCDTERETTAQPRARLKCANCGDIFAAPPLVPRPEVVSAGRSAEGADDDDDDDGADSDTPAADADPEAPAPGVEVVVVDGVDIDPVEVIPEAATTATTDDDDDGDDGDPSSPPPTEPAFEAPPPTVAKRLNPRGRRRASRRVPD